MTNGRCDRCGAVNIPGSQFCGGCGSAINLNTPNLQTPQIYPNMQPAPAYPQYYQPAPMMAPKRKGHSVLIAIVAVILVVALIGAVSLIGNAQNGSSASVKTGDYILYNLSGTAGGITVNGSCKMTFTQVTSSAMTVEYQVTIGSNPTQTTYQHTPYLLSFYDHA
jgi:hypothetical protein